MPSPTKTDGAALVERVQRAINDGSAWRTEEGARIANEFIELGLCKRPGA